jgi:hypothetical protein
MQLKKKSDIKEQKMPNKVPYKKYMELTQRIALKIFVYSLFLPIPKWIKKQEVPQLQFIGPFLSGYYYYYWYNIFLILPASIHHHSFRNKGRRLTTFSASFQDCANPRRFHMFQKSGTINKYTCCCFLPFILRHMQTLHIIGPLQRFKLWHSFKYAFVLVTPIKRPDLRQNKG